ncbi:MAG TPA: hypothetical protein VLX92_22260 [Kofleriaceae bacterium]|nr:hypothetical protein [Kofleriaceae bacterium]
MPGYEPQSPDTSADAERFLIARYRAMTPAEKLEMFRALCRTAEAFAIAGSTISLDVRGSTSSCDVARRCRRPGLVIVGSGLHRAGPLCAGSR